MYSGWWCLADIIAILHFLTNKKLKKERVVTLVTPTKPQKISTAK
jgi:hypothetical protein